MTRRRAFAPTGEPAVGANGGALLHPPPLSPLPDRRYRPSGYLADVDASLELKRRGWRVLYQPRAEVVHLGALTSQSLRNRLCLPGARTPAPCAQLALQRPHTRPRVLA